MIEQRVAKQLNVPERSVAATLKLLDEGATVPFIARYRKEATGNLDEVQIRSVEQIAGKIRILEARRTTILESIRSQGKLGADLEKKILNAVELVVLEDLYAPFKPKRKTKASQAIDAGLEPLADEILKDQDPWPLAGTLTTELYKTAKDAVAGAQDILADRFSNDAKARGYVRETMRAHGKVTVKKRRGSEIDPTFQDYYDFSDTVRRIKPHQVLALRRGESEKSLSVSIALDDERTVSALDRDLNHTSKNRKLVKTAVEDSYSRLIKPGIEREIRSELDETADQHAIDVFALNLKNLLLQAPLIDRRILAIDPGMRSGCKIIVVDQTSNVLGQDIVYVHDNRKREASAKIAALSKKYDVDTIAIGNGTGSTETQEVVADAIVDTDLKYAVVDEAGASVYSASDIAREEFPDMDVSFRGAVSIARRLQDPLSELVKIDAKSIGVGMYQHDVNQKRLEETVQSVVVDAVNGVGVELRVASASLLSYVAGLTPAIAKRIVAYRLEKGFRRRKDLLKVKGIGPKNFEQAAGFLRLRDGVEPLDRTAIHPERYDAARAILKAVDSEVGAPDLKQKLEQFGSAGELKSLAEKHDVGEFTLRDILEDLVSPGRDPRGDVPPPELRAKSQSIEDLVIGMKMVGTVRNVVDFGAFVDIGMKDDGLVHISKLANRFVKNPHDIVAVGDRVDVTVESIDKARKRIGLSMID